jgi:2-keto-4-pentenoate hydratase/2-oxohepta-3-ene-1,7-dioic acid hydratase in catechol pathway
MGLAIDETVYDAEACAAFLGMPPVATDLLGALRSGQAEALRALHNRLIERERERERERGKWPQECRMGIADVRLLAPIPRPPKIICLGLNYRDHASEQGARLPEVPLLFAKAPTAVAAPGDPIIIPRQSEKIDYEGELALVIGSRLKHADPAGAEAGIFGYCCMNDVTDREIQRERVWFRAKGIDTFAPLGPWVVTRDELGDPLKLGISTRVNSEVMQSSSTGNLIFTPTDIVEFITRYMTLEPGDVISTGTPAGVGTFRKPPVYLKHGDVVEVRIEGIGTLSNPVIKEA